MQGNLLSIKDLGMSVVSQDFSGNHAAWPPEPQPVEHAGMLDIKMHEWIFVLLLHI